MLTVTEFQKMESFFRVLAKIANYSVSDQFRNDCVITKLKPTVGTMESVVDFFWDKFSESAKKQKLAVTEFRHFWAFLGDGFVNIFSVTELLKKLWLAHRYVI